jgi:antitoxin component of MazEF toxin-antitoxin module
MPIKRKICKIGSGFAVFLPKSWVTLLREEHERVEAVTIEVDGQLVIKPIIEDTKITKQNFLFKDPNRVSR